MLFIHGALDIGGIETFFVRMAKIRYRKGLNTSILLLSEPHRSNEELLEEMRKYADVYFLRDLFHTGIAHGLIHYFPLLLRVRSSRVKEIFESIDQIHGSDGMCLLLGYKLSKVAGIEVPVTFGSYHYSKHNRGKVRFYYERINRSFIFEYLPHELLMFFSKGNREYYEKKKNIDLSKSHIFRLGVVDDKYVKVTGDISVPLRICTVGRLVEQKSYNLFMVDVIRSLIDRGIHANFDIYGYGPNEKVIDEKIRALNLEDYVFLKGTLEYSIFDEVVSSYDMFIGSGTAIIQAASLGVVSIVGVENIDSPQTYGYFSEVCSYEYNLKGLNLPLFNVIDLIDNFEKMNPLERFNHRQAHLNSIRQFTNEGCQSSLNALKNGLLPNEEFRFNRWLYEVTRLLDYFYQKICSSIFKNKFF
jgi:hypothetical protein